MGNCLSGSPPYINCVLQLHALLLLFTANKFFFFFFYLLVTFPMTLTDPNPFFKATALLKSNISKTVRPTDKSYYHTLIGNHT